MPLYYLWEGETKDEAEPEDLPINFVFLLG